MEPLALGLDSDADAAAGRPREPAGAPAAPPAPEAVAPGVDWTRPPYTVGGIVTLVLDGEDPATIPRPVTYARVKERYRQLKAAGSSDRRWIVDASNFRQVAHGVFAHAPG